MIDYENDGYIKAKWSVTLWILTELKCVLKEDADLELNVPKTSILPKDTTQESVFDVTHRIITVIAPLTQSSGDVSLVSFCPEGFVGIGVPIDTDVFVENFCT